ncbi:MAG TPA: hypothetical protein DDX39_01175 [Bacteroidales bacterium]|nr:MAG: hypothetical protein A2W98_07385 [Bacteroidetes bacterium GWF2_33_38]OFY89763.1 MAG: hypothetical protein A2236_10740 [Bacteroidetes bacterium RIFOXYA2_FULL_33_7]HBF87223.1 hypothetical protein [Bacteroidales bacterium]
MSKFIIYLVLSLLLNNTSFAQCLKGDCQNGNGKYDFGWCVYEGQFKSGLMHGVGTIDYGGNEKFTGEFTDGKENGKGILYHADGSSENVEFNMGTQVKKSTTVFVDIGEPIAPTKGCLEGDCVNGYGTYVYPGGNKYVGYFNNCAREGHGTCFLANGDRFEGLCHNNYYLSGIYYYSNGYKFRGKYDDEGYEYNGAYYSPKGDSIEVKDGKEIIPPPPPPQPQTMLCPTCKGSGQIISGGGMRYGKIEKNYLMGHTVDDVTKIGSWGGTVTSYGVSCSPVTFETCPTCNGYRLVEKK